MIDLNLDSLFEDEVREPKFKIGDEIVDPTSGLNGTIIKVEDPVYSYMPYQYEVVLSNGKKSRFEEDCLQRSFDVDDVFALCENRNFANYEDYMIVNTLFKIDNVNANTISTLRASRTQFKAYQFKPLLKFFASPSKRILIADEVGLGKTIEAGHILLELKARKEFRNAIIICPKSLREKWQTEMNQRFGIDFTIYGGEDSEGNKYPSMADLFKAYEESGREVRAIVNYERLRYRKPKKDGVKDPDSRRNLINLILEKNIQHSVVICDESHRLRNESTLMYNGAEILLSKTDAAIFLTATPVMIKEDNLFYQMHLLDPEKYSDAQIFSNRMSQGRPFVLALSELCAGRELSKIWKRLKEQRVERIVQAETKFGLFTYKKEQTVEESFSLDPIYERIKQLFNAEDCAKTRAALQLNLVKMSAIQNEFTRTTKRQIRNELSKVNERFPCKVSILLTQEEQKFFDKVINDYGEKNSDGSSNLGLVQIKRMVSSSVYGYLNKREDLERDVDIYDEKPDAKVNALISEILQPSKSNHMRDIKKVIVFAVFTDTLRYLKIRLSRKGIKCALIDGSIEDRQAIIDKFKDDDEIRVLLSSEVGSEGLDMQFCDTIVNYDLPWNPMVVEQRIGRIDRIGQVADNIYIYNFIVKGSITEDIYERLEKRIGIFKGTIGDLEPILSAPYKDGQSILEAHNNIETLYYNGEITKEQALREEELINQAIAAQRLTIEELNSEMNKNTISMDSYYDEQINLIQKNKAFVTEVELRNLLVKVLAIKETGCSQCFLEQSCDDERIWVLKIPHNLQDRNCLVDFLSRHRPLKSDALKVYDDFINRIRGKGELRLTFNQTMANEDRHIIFVNNYSPLILACNEFRENSGFGVKKVFKLELMAAEDRNNVLHSGDKFFMLNYQLHITDFSAEKAGAIKELCPVVYDIKNEKIISDEDVISSICCLAQDQGRETQLPTVEECSHETVARFKALATQYIIKFVAEKKKDIDEQNNAERGRWAKEFREFYESKIQHYKREVEKLEEEVDEYSWMPEEYGVKRRNEIQGYKGTITRLNRELNEKLAKLDYESNVKISHEEISACFISIR